MSAEILDDITSPQSAYITYVTVHVNEKCKCDDFGVQFLCGIRRNKA